MTRPDIAHRRFLQVGLIAPIPIVVLGVAAQLAALPGLPDPAAVHWGLDGRPDGFGPAWTFPVLTVLIGLGMPAIMVGALALQRSVDPKTRSRGPAYRFLGAFALAVATFTVVLLTGAVLIQVGVTDAAAGPALWAPLLAAVVSGGLAALIGWSAQPRTAVVRAAGAAVAPLPLGATERAVWMRTATMARGGMALLIGSVLLVLGLGIGLILAGEAAAGWITIGVGALLALLVASTTAFHVTVDDSGLTVRSSAGLPAVAVPITEIVRAEVVRVEPLAEFGGWGMRWGPTGRFGVVLRAGEALEVHRTNGKALVVTVDDAGTAASLLATFAARP